MHAYPFELPAPVTRIEVMGPHMTKHHLANRQVVHHFTQADTGDAHDHPWPFESTILAGGYEENEYIIREDGSCDMACYQRLPGQSHSVKADTIHRITRLLLEDCWTLCTPGLKEKEPGFYRVDETGVWHRFWFSKEWQLIVPATLVA